MKMSDDECKSEFKCSCNRCYCKTYHGASMDIVDAFELAIGSAVYNFDKLKSNFDEAVKLLRSSINYPNVNTIYVEEVREFLDKVGKDD